LSLAEFNSYLPWTYKRVNLISKPLWELLFAEFEVQTVSDTKITNIMVFLYIKQFGNCDPCCPKNQRKIITWFIEKGRSIYNLEQLESFFSTKPQSVIKNKCDGFNLVGYNRGRLGLGEDLRGYIKIFEYLDIPFSVYHIGHSSDAPEEYSHKNEGYSLPYKYSIFCMNIIELDKLIHCYDDDLSPFGYCIAASPWELPRVPDRWSKTLRHFDEVWAISRFVEKSYSKTFENRLKIQYVAPVVSLPKSSSAQKINRQPRPFTFLYIFDAKSYMARKNPVAVVEAFLKAFQSNEPVRLVVKSTSEGCGDDWQFLNTIANSDYRISLTVGSVDESEMEKFWQRCDCYVSLHKSEGFGRTLVEAVSRKIPVVATGWSGSTDIIDETNHLAVDFSLKQLKDNDYPEADGQYWAEPLESSAIKKLKWVYANRSSVELFNIVRKNYIHFKENFSVTAVGRNQLLQRYINIG
tara:strand:+ start:95 stop:1489 length:1395 start_codon:yes stop_codon:yes gene_type:complete